MSTTLEVRWTTSRARESYGYNVCTLYADGERVARCNGGGYDMEGTCLGDYIARFFADRLRAMPLDKFPQNSHWERNEHPRRICRNTGCLLDHIEKASDIEWLASDCYTCPKCGGETDIDWQDGRRVDDGPGFYGLRFHDPNYDASKAIIGKDCPDRTLANDGSEGQTVAEAEAAGKSFGLERLAAEYGASSPVPTHRHTVPTIDGACGKSSVQRIAEAIGLRFECIPTRGKKSTIYTVHDSYAK